MNLSEVSALSAEVEKLKKDLNETLTEFKEKKTTNNEALVKTRILDGLQKCITTTIHLDGIKQAIKFKMEEQQGGSDRQSSKGRNYQKVNYR